MKTEIISIDINNMEKDKLRYAASVLKQGGLVAFPTETVYGLGADALNPSAVKNIFKAKGRPSDNPLIVHISDISFIDSLVSNIPAKASVLMKNFWPGPLTIVFNKSDIVPQIITAGLETVAVRMPYHPVALALINESGLCIAAPSANISGRPSPTIARHVIEDLSGRVDVIIDAGCSNVGLESTVLDVTCDPPVILRPGGITPSQLENCIGEIGIDPFLSQNKNQTEKPKAPGMKYTHYSPKAQVIVIEGDLKNVVNKINELIEQYKTKGLNLGVMATDETSYLYSGVEVMSSGSRHKPVTIASNLFRLLREFDEMKVDLILAEAVDNTGIGMAVMNRLNKAAGFNIIRV